MGIKVDELPVGHYMTAYPMSVGLGVPFNDAVDIMDRRGFGSLVVLEEDNTTVRGLFTEREILENIVRHKGIPEIKMKDLDHLQQVVKISPDTTVAEAASKMIVEKARPLIFANGDKLVGIITASDMLRAFRQSESNPSLGEVTSKTIQYCSYLDSILDAAKIMNTKRIGSVIIESENYDEQASMGIFTERDLLKKVLVYKADLKQEVGKYSTFPLITVKEGINAQEAASIMAANNIKRLALVNSHGVDLKGIVTARDIVESFQLQWQLVP